MKLDVSTSTEKARRCLFCDLQSVIIDCLLSTLTMHLVAHVEKTLKSVKYDSSGVLYLIKHISRAALKILAKNYWVLYRIFTWVFT